MSAHTPGPWVLQGGQIYAVPAEAIDASSDFEPFCIADRDMDQRIDFDTIGEANGLLIAAAPDLLSALQHLLRHSGIADVDQRDKDKQDQDVERAARAAIAKAAGGA